MACPNTEDGFVMIALELGAALAMAKLTTAEQVVVWEVVAQTFGPSKAPAATLSASDLAKRTGLDRAFLAKGIASLVASNMLVKARDGHKLQKNYDRWDRTAHKEAEAHTKARREYAKASIRAARIRHQDTSSDCVNTDTPPVSILTQTCVNTDTPILYRELRVSEETPPSPPQGGETTTDGTGSGPKAEDAPPIKPFVPPALFAGFRVDPGNFEPDEDELGLACRFIEEQFTQKQHPFTRALARVSRQFPSDWFLKALITARAEELEVAGKEIKTFGYVVEILDRWTTARRPEPGAAWEDYDDTMNLRDREKHRRRAKLGPAARIVAPAVPDAPPDYLKFAEGCVPAPARPKGQSA